MTTSEIKFDLRCWVKFGSLVLWMAVQVALLHAQPRPKTVAEVRNAPPTAGKDITATLRGTVTTFSGWKNSFFLQDFTGAISIDRLENARVRPGDRIEVTGRVRAGLFANVLVSQRIAVLGHGDLPTARPVSYQELKAGDYDSALVELRGIVHSVHIAEMWGRQMLFLDLKPQDELKSGYIRTGTETLTAYLPDIPNGDLQPLVESTVRIRGACGTIFNSRRQLIGVRLFVAGLNQVEVLTPGQSAASIPVSPLASLLTVHGPSPEHRVHIRGTVTYQAQDGDVFLQDGPAAIPILNSTHQALPVGSQAEAWGFISTQGDSPAIENGLVRVTGTGKHIEPIRIRAADAVRVENGFVQAPYEGLLVQLEAKIVERISIAGTSLWTLESQGVTFQAEIGNGPRDWALNLEAGMSVGITGICVTKTDALKNLHSFHILVRSPADVVKIQTAHWNQSMLVLLAIDFAILTGGLLLYLGAKRQDAAAKIGKSEGATQVKIGRRWPAGFTLFAIAMASVIALNGAAGTQEPILSAMALLAASAAIWLSQWNTSKSVKPVRLACSWFVIASGVTSLAAGYSSWQSWATSANAANVQGAAEGIFKASQMPLATAFSLVLVGCASLWMKSERLASVGQFLAVVVAFNSLLKLVGTLYEAQSVTGLAAHLVMSTPCALGLVALSAALLLGAPESGLMKAACAAELGGFMFRRTLPGAILTPLAVGWIRLQLQVFGLIDTRFGLTLFALSNALGFCFVLWSIAAVLNRLDRIRARAESAVRDRDRKLGMIFETGVMGDFNWDVESDSVTAHSSIWALYGETENPVNASSGWFTERQHPEDLTRIAEELKKVQAERRPFDLEFRVIWPDRSIHWLYCRAVASFDNQGKISQTSGINLDITDRKLAEGKVRENERLLRELQDAMPQIVWTSDSQGNIQHHNRRWYEYTCLLPGADWGQIIHPEDLASTQLKWTDSLQSGLPYEHELRMRRASDGAYRWHLGRALPVRNAEGTVSHWFGTATDIDDFKRASREIAELNETLERRIEERTRQLRETEGRYGQLVDSVKDYAIYMLDVDGNVSSWNAGAERLKGYTAAEIIGRHISVFYIAEEIRGGDPKRHLAKAAEEGTLYREAPRVRKDGSEFWASILISAIYDGDGHVSGFSKVVRDITERRRAESLLIAAQRRAEEANMAKSSFLAAMSHEIRTPMNAILGMADLLWETQLDATQRQYVGRFRRAGSNLLTLINDILDLSKIESGLFELETIDFDLLELVDRAMELASPRATLKDLGLETHIVHGTPAFLMGDPGRLQQVLNNLIGNAIKFTHSGKIAVTVGPHPDGVPGHLEFAITDTGIGIPEDKLISIFEDFTQAESSTTRRFGGTGLGLGICRRLVEKMMGTLTVESMLDVGSTFRFDASFKVNAGVAGAPPPELSNLSGKCVLVVDDNSTNCIIVCEMCAGWGMQTQVASSASQALALIRKAQRSGEEFSLVLLDRILPGSEALETLEEIKRLDSEVAVIISSSDNRPGDITEAKALGAAAYLMKPIRRTELLTCIFAALSSRKRHARAQPESGPAPTHRRPFRVLLVEDSEDNRFLVEAYLAGKAYELTFAEDGQLGVEAFSKAAFDAVLMDIQMPVMDGLSATVHMRALERERGQKPTPIIALTAHALVEDSERSYEAGCNGHLAKPISKEKLIAGLERFRPVEDPSNAPLELAGGTDSYVINIPAGFENHSRKYIKSQLEGMSKVRSSLADGSVDQLRIMGHNLKGAGTSYGFPNLASLGAAIEEAAKASDLKQLEVHVARVERYVRYAADCLT